MTRWKRLLLSAIFSFLFPSFFLSSFLVHEASGSTPEPTRLVTKNGMVLLIVEQPSLPIVSVKALVRAGAVYDPPKKAGLANITASLLDEGTAKRTALQFSEATDAIGARLSVSAGHDHTTAGLRVLKKDIEIGFDLLSDILMNPVFNSDEVDRVRKNILGEIAAEKDEPRAIGGRAFRRRVFGDHPYRHPANGHEGTLKNIERNDLLAFHRQYYRPNNIVLSIVGDISREEALRLVRKYFGKWEAEEILVPKIASPQPLQSGQTIKIDKALKQATVIFGHVGIERTNPDYYAVLVMNYILGGGGFSSRMMTDIRDNQGLVYSIYSRFSGNHDPGPFSVTLQTENANAPKAIQSVLKAITRMRSERVSEQELSEAKAYLIGSFPLRIDTTRKVANLLPQIEFHQLGLDYFTAYGGYLERVTRDDVLRVAKKYLDTENYVLVVVGNQSEIEISE